MSSSAAWYPAWKHIFSIIEHESNHFQQNGIIENLIDPTPYASRQAAKEDLINKERESSEVLHEACRQFSKTRKWPLLEKWQILILMHRMREALNLLRFFETGDKGGLKIVPDFDDDIPEEEILEFLLIYYWSHIGKERYLCEQILHL